jgi:AcrR family transcriptional regulator
MIEEISITQTIARRNRRIIRQRKAIMDAAAQLFAQNGYQGTSIKDIAALMDIGESTLYGYFPGKQEILIAILNQQVEMVDSLLEHLNELNDRESFVNLIDLITEKIVSNLVYNRVMFAEAWLNDKVLKEFVMARWLPVMGLLQIFISKKTVTGMFRPIDPQLAARMIIATYIGALLPVLRGIEPPPNPKQRHILAESIVDLLFNGLSVQKGLG